MLIAIDPCAFHCMSLYLPKPTFLHTGCHPKPWAKNSGVISMLLYFSQIMIVHDNTKRLPDMLPISNNQQ
jgi:hypothetical protein